MMTITTTILATPFIIAIWSLDAFTWLLVARLVLGHLATTSDTTVVKTLGELVAPLQQAVGRKLAGWRQRPLPGLMAWIVLVVLLLGARHVLIVFVTKVL